MSLEDNPLMQELVKRTAEVDARSVPVSDSPLTCGSCADHQDGHAPPCPRHAGEIEEQFAEVCGDYDEDGPEDTEGCLVEPECGMNCDHHNGFVWEYEPVTAEAERIVFGDRGDDYGHPAEDFKRFAAMVSGYLGVEVDENDMAMILILLKVSRQKNKVKRDNACDIAGYALCADRIRAYKEVLARHEFANGGSD